MTRILITGGAGYIGSQTAKTLMRNGYDVYVYDWNIKPWAVAAIPSDQVFKTDFADKFFLPYAFERIKPEAIIHFAALHQVNDSVNRPNDFYKNNVVKSRKLLEHARCAGTPIIFSGTASVYGNPTEKVEKFTEAHPVNPMNPYAKTKLAVEWMLEDYHKAYGLNHMILRYFNAAGADPGGKLGYVQEPKSHIVPILMNKIHLDQTLSVYGNQYPTPDGTCVRDYTHVADLATAHLAALDYLLSNTGSIAEKVNIGSGRGTSVLELIDAASKVLGKKIDYKLEDAREGDPASLVADITKAKDLLNWSSQFSIDEIIQHAWKWELEGDKVTSQR